MSDIFDDRKKALEEEYFRKKEQELIENETLDQDSVMEGTQLDLQLGCRSHGARVSFLHVTGRGGGHGAPTRGSPSGY
jgi:hypothetical protein